MKVKMNWFPDNTALTQAVSVFIAYISCRLVAYQEQVNFTDWLSRLEEYLCNPHLTKSDTQIFLFNIFTTKSHKK